MIFITTSDYYRENRKTRPKPKKTKLRTQDKTKYKKCVNCRKNKYNLRFNQCENCDYTTNIDRTIQSREFVRNQLGLVEQK